MKDFAGGGLVDSHIFFFGEGWVCLDIFLGGRGNGAEGFGGVGLLEVQEGEGG